MKIAFVTNICAHYRVKTFETLARYHSVDYYFFSAGDEWYWQQRHGVQRGAFRHRYLPGVRVGGTRITPTLPLQLLTENYDAYIKCINGRFALPVTYLVARLQRKPFILWTGIWMRLETPAHRLFYPLTRYFYRHADAIVTYGDHVGRFLVSEGVPAERIFSADHALDNEAYREPVPAETVAQLRAQLSIQPGQHIILFLGRLEAIKGLPFLLEAFARANRNDAVLVIAGDGGQREQLLRQASELGIAEQVRFVGYVPTAESRPYYALADVFVLPSITMPSGRETWGLVVNEAFNQSVPVIATEAVGAAAGGLVRHGENGLIVPERNSAALADAIRLLLDQPALREQMGRSAAAEVLHWDNERMVGGFREAIAYASRRH